MDNETSIEQEIAESFINGNISWCRAQLMGKPALLARVALLLEEYPYGDYKGFLKIMGNPTVENFK